MFFRLAITVISFLFVMTFCGRDNSLIVEANTSLPQNDSIKVVIPYDRMTAILRGEVIDSENNLRLSNKEKYKLLRFIDKNECSICQIKALHQWDDEMDLIGREKIELLVIVEPENDAMISTLLAVLQKNYFSYPVWVDGGSYFFESNVKLCQNSGGGCYLLDSEGNLVYSGNPLSSKSSQNEIIEIVYKNGL